MSRVLTPERPVDLATPPEPTLPSRKPRQLRAMFVMARYALVAQTRNPATLIFGFLFPLIFVIVFGFIGNSTFSAAIGVPDDAQANNPIYVALGNIPAAHVTHSDEATLEQQLRQGKIDAILRVRQTGTGQPSTYAADVVTSTANVQKSAATVALIDGVINNVDLRLLGATTPPISISQKQVSGRQARYIDFALPGQIGLALLSTAVFGTVFGMIYLKKSLVFKRMFATPVRGMSILLAQGLSRLVVAIGQAAVIIVVGVVAFQFYLPHGWSTFLAMMLLSAFGLLVFLGFGLLIAGVTIDENGAGPITNLFTLPQFLLSGTFFSADNFPSWIQPIANNLPLSYFNSGMRKLASEGAGLDQIWPSLLGLAVWGVLAYVVAARTFKWA